MPDAAGQGAGGSGEPGPGVPLSRKCHKMKIFLTPLQPWHPSWSRCSDPGLKHELSLQAMGGTGCSGCCAHSMQIQGEKHSRSWGCKPGRAQNWVLQSQPSVCPEPWGSVTSGPLLPCALQEYACLQLAVSQRGMPFGLTPHPGEAPLHLCCSPFRSEEQSWVFLCFQLVPRCCDTAVLLR